MKFARRVAIAVKLGSHMPELFKSLRKLEFLNECEVHFVYSYQTTTYAVGLGESALVFPVEADRKSIEQSAVATLKSLSRSVFPEDFKGKLFEHCLFSDDPKRKFCDYVKEKNIDLIIVAAREKRGLFESSFTLFVSKHTDSNMIILKHGV